MAVTVLSLARRHVLGTLYDRCDALTSSVPVYLAGDDHDLLGYMDESLGQYADAFSFHLDPESCKRLSAGQFSYTIDYLHSEPQLNGDRGRVQVTSITLVRHKGYEKPIKTVEVSK